MTVGELQKKLALYPDETLVVLDDGSDDSAVEIFAIEDNTTNSGAPMLILSPFIDEAEGSNGA